MEEAVSFYAVIEPNQLVEPVVVLADREIRLVSFRDDRQLVVGILPSPLIADLQDA